MSVHGIQAVEVPGWLLPAIGAVALVYAVVVGVLFLAGRHTQARAVTRFLPDVIVLFRRLAADPRVPRRHKVLALVLLAYVASPVDLVLDFLPAVGQLDDAILVVLLLRSVVRAAGPDVLVELWPGPRESLDLLLALAFGRAGRPATGRRDDAATPAECEPTDEREPQN